jgi:hypothetical protein
LFLCRVTSRKVYSSPLALRPESPVSEVTLTKQARIFPATAAHLPLIRTLLGLLGLQPESNAGSWEASGFAFMHNGRWITCWCTTSQPPSLMIGYTTPQPFSLNIRGLTRFSLFTYAKRSLDTRKHWLFRMDTIPPLRSCQHEGAREDQAMHRRSI